MPDNEFPPAVKLPVRAQNAFVGSLPLVENTYGPLNTALPKTIVTDVLNVCVDEACEVAVIVTI
jgi:hypothetical protein